MSRPVHYRPWGRYGFGCAAYNAEAGARRFALREAEAQITADLGPDAEREIRSGAVRHHPEPLASTDIRDVDCRVCLRRILDVLAKKIGEPEEPFDDEADADAFDYSPVA